MSGEVSILRMETQQQRVEMSPRTPFFAFASFYFFWMHIYQFVAKSYSFQSFPRS